MQITMKLILFTSAMRMENGIIIQIIIYIVNQLATSLNLIVIQMSIFIFMKQI